MKVFTEKVGGKYCPSFRFGNQKFHLRGFDTKKESELMEKPTINFEDYQPPFVCTSEGRVLDTKEVEQAYSDMIDALVGIIKNIEDDPYTTPDLDKAEKALKKAGVQC